MKLALMAILCGMASPYVCLGAPADDAEALLIEANALRGRGDYKAALGKYRAALAVAETSPNQDLRAKAANNLAVTEQALGDFDSASQHLKQAIELWGDSVPASSAMINLAEVHRQLDRLDEAVGLYQRALKIREKAGEPRALATALNGLGVTLKAAGRMEEARRSLLRAVGLIEELDPTDALLAAPLNNLAELHRGQKEYAEAEALYRRCLAIRERTIGLEHPDSAATMNNLAATLHGQGDFERAEPLYRESLRIRRKVFGPAHQTVGIAMNNLGTMLRAAGRSQEAEEMIRSSLPVLEKTLGTAHPTVASVANNLGELYASAGRLAEAEPMYRRALEIHRLRSGPPMTESAAIQRNLGMLFMAQEKYKAAEVMFRESLASYQRIRGADSAESADVIQALAMACLRQGRNSEAGALFRRAEQAGIQSALR
ncbi:MAG: tetratricopeptide repeat protein [Acidobacteria bacterium]|nr:tetratricopeptide repeat protein [Acidobacteriota bacterium]